MNENRPLDRRIQRTRPLLQEALYGNLLSIL